MRTDSSAPTINSEKNGSHLVQSKGARGRDDVNYVPPSHASASAAPSPVPKR